MSLPAAIESYRAYPFDTDENYQQGLASLMAGGAISHNLTFEEQEEALRRTRVFYFNRVTGNSLLVEDVRNLETLSESTPQDAQQREEQLIHDPTETVEASQTRVLTFAELQELIESGKVDQIPNNKVIPERFSEATPSQSSAPLRKKPWEIAAEMET